MLISLSILMYIFNIRELLVGAVLPCVLVGACSVIVPTAIVYLMEDGWQRFIILSLLTERS